MNKEEISKQLIEKLRKHGLINEDKAKALIAEKKKLNEGRGNVKIRYDGQNWPTYYVENDYSEEPADDDSEEGTYDYDTFWDDFLLNVDGIAGVERVQNGEWIDSESRVYFENDEIKVVIADNEWSLAVGCIPANYDNEEEDGGGYDKEAFRRAYVQFFNELNQTYPLHVATSAWTSGKVEGPITENIFRRYKKADITDTLHEDFEL